MYTRSIRLVSRSMIDTVGITARGERQREVSVGES